VRIDQLPPPSVETVEGLAEGTAAPEIVMIG
jgi:hypothetical protein